MPAALGSTSWPPTSALSWPAQPEPAASIFPRPLARNVVPQVGSFDADGWSGEECKVRDESKKMLGLPELQVSVTAVRVPGAHRA